MKRIVCTGRGTKGQSSVSLYVGYTFTTALRMLMLYARYAIAWSMMEQEESLRCTSMGVGESLSHASI
jgi:hypothetical protein